MEVERFAKNHQLEDLRRPANDNVPVKWDCCIKQIIEREGFINYEIYKKCVSTNGGNYLGTLYEVDVKGRTKDGEKELNIFVKQIIEMASPQLISITDVYNTEMFAYKELSMVFTELQHKANVPAEERYKMVKAYEETNSEAIIMDNMVKRGYTTCYRMNTMSLKFLEKSVEQLAKFHALSLVLKVKRPNYFENKIKSLKTAFIFEDAWHQMAKHAKDSTMYHVDDKYKDKVAKIYEDLIVKCAEYYNDESIQTCLCHGDYRANNIMVKMDEEGEIQEIIPVDYQLIHYGCPVFDFLYLLITGTNRDFRKAHTSDLKDLYYQTLSNFLKYFDIEANMVYPRKEFEKVYKEKLDFGLMTALLFLPFVLVSEDDIPDISKDITDLALKVDYRFKDRLRGVIEDYAEWGYL